MENMTEFSDVILPGSYEAGPKDSGIEHSERKLYFAAEELKIKLPHQQHLTIESWPCQKEDETWAYRCQCTFQILMDDDETNGKSVYAMRTEGKAIPIGRSYFPIATRRIQTAMKNLMEDILDHSSEYPHIVTGLTSVTFSSSWHDIPDADCIVTLMYGQPVLEESMWKIEAMKVCLHMKLRQLYGRAKKSLFVAISDDERRLSTLRDTLYIHRQGESLHWEVNLTSPEDTAAIQIHYEKPNTAFFHPNSFAMKDALAWILNRLSYITRRTDRESPVRTSLLEMYCGCGAHTVALGKSGLLEEIVAIELDHRLIEACEYNVRLNGLDDLVQVIQGDAGKWAKRSYKWMDTKFDILLVDPPRAGLDEDVCKMAKNGTFDHFLYISCGHDALLRDLDRLSDCFDVVHCRQLDLFPRTNSIESLIHLQRRRQCEESNFGDL